MATTENQTRQLEYQAKVFSQNATQGMKEWKLRMIAKKDLEDVSKSFSIAPQTKHWFRCQLSCLSSLPKFKHLRRWDFPQSYCWLLGLPGNSAGKESACNAGDPGSFPGLGRSAREGIGYSLQYSLASLMTQLIKNLPAMWETWVQSLGWEDPLRKGTDTHSSSLAWRIPGAA